MTTAPFKPEPSLSLSSAAHTDLDGRDKLSLALLGLGLLGLVAAAAGAGSWNAPLTLWFSVGLVTLGGLAFTLKRQLERPAGVDNDHMTTRGATARGAAGWILAVVLTGVYVLYYWFPDSLVHLTRMTDPLSHALRGKSADPWFMYSLLYTLAVVIMGARAIAKYRHSRYHIVRTTVIMGAQTVFAFLIPSLLKKMNEPEEYVSYFWPLNPKPLWPEKFAELMDPQFRLGTTLLALSLFLTFVATPVLTYFFGKRWYCSWVCGCGGLANTAGDPFRHLSDKSLRAWKIERWTIHGVLVLVVLTTVLLWVDAKLGILGSVARPLEKIYGFAIIAAFAGVIGVGFYPLLGSRVWCRFGCPMAAILGILQKWFSRYRITTNGAQCISCGNCSTYCEMGIDVRWYAQRQQDVVRASCVGCGMCATVCPRGVLSLENGPQKTRAYGTYSLNDLLKSGISSERRPK